jgi:hypothetical protein
MSVAFLMDANVPQAITAQLRLRGVDVLTAQEDASDQIPDEDLLLRAATLGRVLSRTTFAFGRWLVTGFETGDHSRA